MKIENINSGLCDYRASHNQPCFFVNWQQDGENQYEFFHQVFAMYSFKRRLILKQLENLSGPLSDNDRGKIIAKIWVAFTINETLASVRASHSKLSRTGYNGNGRTPVIILTAFYPDHAYYGVQFWTEEMIKQGHQKNTDGTTAIFCDKL